MRIVFVASQKGVMFIFVQFDIDVEWRRVVPLRIPTPNSQSHNRKASFQAEPTNRTEGRC